MAKTATFLIHRTTCAFPARPTADDLRAKADDSDVYDSNVEQILRRHVKMPEEKWTVHRTRDLLISADQAVEFGMAHEISDFIPAPGAPLVNV
jgi:ATP-dependent protease ClpP protease subunit